MKGMYITPHFLYPLVSGHQEERGYGRYSSLSRFMLLRLPTFLTYLREARIMQRCEGGGSARRREGEVESI